MEELMRWRRDHIGAHDLAAVERRRAYLARLSPRDVELIELALLPQAQKGRQDLVYQNARPYQGRLDFTNDVRLATELNGLLALASVPGDDPRFARQRLEALMTFDAAVGMHALERRTSFAQTKHALENFQRHFVKTFFDGSVEQTVWTSHDTRDDYHILDVTEDGPHPKRPKPKGGESAWAWVKRKVLDVFHPLRVIRHSLFCRRMRLDGELVAVVFDYRIKERYAEWLKVQKQYDDPKRRANAFQIQDRCGLLLAVPDEHYVRRTVAAVLEFLKDPSLGATIIEVKTPDSGDPSDLENEHTHDRYAVSKITVAIDGQFFEIQIQSRKDSLATRTTTDGVNHDMYRFQQCVDVYFPLLFPPAVYQVDWTSRAVRRELTLWKILSLGLLADVRVGLPD